MWAIQSGGYDSILDLFGDDARVVMQFIDPNKPYQVEVLTFRNSEVNRFRLIEFEVKVDRWDRERRIIGEFDRPEDVVAMIKLIEASNQTY